MKITSEEYLKKISNLQELLREKISQGSRFFISLSFIPARELASKHDESQKQLAIAESMIADLRAEKSDIQSKSKSIQLSMGALQERYSFENNLGSRN